MSEPIPDDLSELSEREVATERDEHDNRLAALFRRWGGLNRREMRELRRMHDERVRLARYVGRLRRRKSKAGGAPDAPEGRLRRPKGCRGF